MVCRATREADRQVVILKILKENCPDPDEAGRFRHEFEMIKDLDAKGVVKPYSLEKSGNSLFIAMEDFGGVSLDRLTNERSFTPPEMLAIFIQIAESLGEIHASNIIHKNIHPGNIVHNPDAGPLKIIDFGVSTMAPRETTPFRNPGRLEGTLPYISPEQTGRMNRPLDYGADLYSLGVTFYELLTGRLPFETVDPLEMVRAHIAKTPPAPRTLDPDIPGPVSDIVMNLMAKTAEERRRSVRGLIADLRGCLEELEAGSAPGSFKIAQNDFSGVLRPPGKLYGREKEIEVLTRAFERVRAGRAEMMLIAGHPGVGKAALMNEVHKPLTGSGGYFISGKFDQPRGDIPYHAFTRAFREFVHLVLTEEAGTAALWKERISAAVHPNGKALTDVFPDLELIIGEQKDLPELDPAETRNRFQRVFEKFIRTISRKERPLVLALEELQWADPASLNLLKILMDEPEDRSLFLIGAHRDANVGPTHPLTTTLDEIKARKAAIHTISPRNLSRDQVGELISDALGQPGGAEDLADLVYEKTGGLPLFVHELLRFLHEKDDLRFDFDKGRWQWDLSRITRPGAPETEADLMTAKIRELPGATRDLLKTAAFMGARFDLEALVIVSGKSEKEVADLVQNALVEGLIAPLGKGRLSMPSQARMESDSYKFIHDRIRRAARALAPGENEEAIHLRIGESPRDKTAMENRDQHLFRMVNHLNKGRKRMEDPRDLLHLAELNLKAGKKAKNSAAHLAALAHFTIGAGLLPEDCWKTHYWLTFSLFKERCECEFLASNFQTSEKLFAVLLDHGRSKMEKADIYAARVAQYVSMEKYAEAIETGVEGLKLFDVDLPGWSARTTLDGELSKIDALTGDEKIEDLIRLPMITDEEKKQRASLLASLITPTCFTDPPLFTLISLKIVRMTLEYGVTRESPFALAVYGSVLAAAREDYRRAYELGEASIQLGEKQKNDAQTCRATAFLVSRVNHWRKHVKTSAPLGKRAFRRGLNAGDSRFANENQAGAAASLLFGGEELSSVMEEIDHGRRFALRIENRALMDFFRIMKQFCLNLRGRTQHVHTFNDRDFDEAQFLESAGGRPPVICDFYIYKLQSLYLFEKHAEALKMAEEAGERIDGRAGALIRVEWVFHHALTLCALLQSAGEEDRKRFGEKLEAHRKQLKKWADNCPENFLHK
ncbi:MAG: serine/threonine-protein kinase PknK, partial [Desulfobacterales bacterium]|nr:serine/threonine-protein kinase PknK [Desulfobacterales bacterium]